MNKISDIIGYERKDKDNFVKPEKRVGDIWGL